MRQEHFSALEHSGLEAPEKEPINTMCRLLYVKEPRQYGPEELEEKFLFLREALGGEGDGVSVLRTGEVLKGIDKTPKELADFALAQDGPIFFHTRRATLGEVVDPLCQPFYIHPITVMHNGHWKNWDWTLQMLLSSGRMRYIPTHLSDSLVGAIAARSWGPGALHQWIDTGCWLYARRNSVGLAEVQAVVNDGTLYYNVDREELCSQACFWKLGEKVLQLNKGTVCRMLPEFTLERGSLTEVELKRKKDGKK